MLTFIKQLKPSTATKKKKVTTSDLKKTINFLGGVGKTVTAITFGADGSYTLQLARRGQNSEINPFDELLK